MTRSIGTRIAVIAVTAVITVVTVSAFGSWAAPAGAATTNPCKVIKRSEIAQVFGGEVSTGKKGVSTPASTQCEFRISAAGERPAGTVTVHVMTTGAKAAYAGLKKRAQYEPIDGLPKSLYAEPRHVVNVLAGDVLLGVQGGFLITDPLPLHFYDDQAQLVDLARIGVTRV
jgi:hypothetical protein